MARRHSAGEGTICQPPSGSWQCAGDGGTGLLGIPACAGIISGVV